MREREVCCILHAWQIVSARMMFTWWRVQCRRETISLKNMLCNVENKLKSSQQWSWSLSRWHWQEFIVSVHQNKWACVAHILSMISLTFSLWCYSLQRQIHSRFKDLIDLAKSPGLSRMEGSCLLSAVMQSDYWLCCMSLIADFLSVPGKERSSFST